jgi:membrane peptidoglycan carboxypeptidase
MGHMTAYRRPAARPRRNGRSQPTTAGWLAVIVFGFLAGLGAIGAFAAVGVYAALASDPELPKPETLTTYVLPQETVILDRRGSRELARFGDARREVVTFGEIPPLVLDATTAIEDKTFWENAGFDPMAIVAAGLDSLRGNSRGASTITQQLVRQRLLPPDLVQEEGRTVERKLKEIIQSIRVTQEFDGEVGKREVITAYLNQNYYGNQLYGIKAAADGYFGVELDELTPAQAAILAALPQSPSNHDLVRNATERCAEAVAEGAECPAASRELVVPEDTRIVQRRDAILDLLAEGRTPLSGDQYSAADFEAAKDEEVVLTSQTTPRWVAPHFVWAVRDELALRLCGADAATCPALDRGGLRVITTLDTVLQRAAEKWVRVAAIAPHARDPEQAARNLGFDELAPWMENLRDKELRNSALVALDYQTGELVAYVGSASYYSTSTRPAFQPQYDVLGKGYRQPGSAFKPFNYAVGIDDRTLTAATMLMDVSTDFGGGYTPNDADLLERGPVRVRNALQFSLNIPAVKAMAINGPDHVFAKAQEFGMDFAVDRTDAGLALALGVQEVRPVDLVTAYGTLANGGRAVGHTTILAVRDRNGNDVVDPYVPPEGTQVVSAQAAFIVTDILAGNTDESVNPFWGRFSIETGEGRRPATLKTGTNNDAKDLNAYGYIAPPSEEGRSAGAYALAVGVWNGNSDNSLVSTSEAPLFSIDVSTYVWQGYLSEVSAEWPVTDFAPPAEGLVQAQVDPWTGFAARSGGPSVTEWFIADTQPRESLPEATCGESVLTHPNVYESRFNAWLEGDRDWLRRAARGPGAAGGPDNTRTSYFYNRRFQPYGASWGAISGGNGCGSPSPSPSCFVVPTPDPSTGIVPSFVVPSPSGSEPVPLPCPPASEEPSAAPSDEASPSVEPSPTPTDTPPSTPEPTAPPTPEPTPTPAPESAPPAEASAPPPPAGGGLPAP